MYCSLGQNQFFDDAGAPLSAGRVKIYAKGSDTLLPIYEDNGDGFVPAQNPVITANDGRIPTVFWPAALVDVVVEKSNGDGTYTGLDSYVAGLDLSSVEAVQEGVSNIAELRMLQPSENMVVQANGYYTAGDCPTRKYLWVAGAANTDDGGYVIASGINAVGRWVMLWDDSEFLPASLYGIMCGYAGYSKTSNMASFAGLGHYVLVGSVRVEVPPVLLFDWRMAQPTSGLSSPIAYHYSEVITTNHYVACARGVVFHTVVQPTIHCAGVRGESFTTAKWMLDRDYTTRDPKERISTLMFYGNTQAMHDAFMACAACAKVYLVELYSGGVTDTLTSSDKFYGIVLNHAGVSNFNFLYGIVINPDAYVYIQQFLRCRNFAANSIYAVDNISTEGSGTFGSGKFGSGIFTEGYNEALNVGKLAKFLHTEFHAPLRLQLNESIIGDDPKKNPVVAVTSGTTLDLSAAPYSSYLDGECLRILNISGNTIMISGAAIGYSLHDDNFIDAFKWDGVWYLDH